MDIHKALQGSRPFAKAPDDALARLAQLATVRHVRHDEPLWRAGEPASHYSVIYSGLVKLVRALPNGREAIIGLAGPRESIGDVAVMQGIPFPASAIVCSDSATVIRIPRDTLLGEMNRSAGLATAINFAIADRVQTLHAKVRILSAGGVEARLAALLLDLGERFGDEFDDGTTRIPIALSRQDLANLVSTTFETTIRVMSRWQKAGWLETTSEGFVLRNIDGLHETAQG